MNEQIRVFAANHRTLWFGAVNDLAKLSLIGMLLLLLSRL
jgi:hypothetical protein